MSRHLYTLLLAQFLTAFADNAILFTALAMVQQAGVAEWYKPALQAAFLVAFVVLAPWVGRLAERRTKGHVLGLGNAIKLAGTLLLLLGLEPLFAYAVVGIGAAIYGPAKYGILPELASEQRLVRANGLVEGATILAIVLGAVAGGHLADHSLSLAMGVIAALYLCSLLVSLALPPTTTRPATDSSALGDFLALFPRFFSTSRARFAMLGASIFWGSAVVLRVMLVSWVPAALFIHGTAEIAELTVWIALGIATGSLLVPWLVPIEQLRRARLAAYLMGLFIILLATSSEPAVARGLLFAIGLSGGIFVVPMNAALQQIGRRTVGAGEAVALQNFFQNLAMLGGTVLYTQLLTLQPNAVYNVAGLGVLVILTTAIIAWHLPRGETTLEGTPESPLP